MSQKRQTGRIRMNRVTQILLWGLAVTAICTGILVARISQQPSAPSRAAASDPQAAGSPGSPEATTTIDGRYIPPPPQPFEGQINLNAVIVSVGPWIV